MKRYSGLLHQLVHKSEVLERFQVVNVQCSHGTIKEHLALLAKNFTDAFLLVLTVIYKRERERGGIGVRGHSECISCEGISCDQQQLCL